MVARLEQCGNAPAVLGQRGVDGAPREKSTQYKMLRQSDLGSRTLQVVVGRSTCVAPDGAACAEEAWQRHHLAKGHIVVGYQS